MKEKIKELIKKFKDHELASPNVLIMDAADLAELRDELNISPEIPLTEFENLQIIVVEETD